MFMHLCEALNPAKYLLYIRKLVISHILYITKHPPDNLITQFFFQEKPIQKARLEDNFI